MKAAITIFAIALACSACSRVDKAAIRREAVARLADRHPRVLLHTAPECASGSSMKGVPHCVLSDVDRSEMRQKIWFQLSAIMRATGVVFEEERDALAARIVHEPGFVDALLGAMVIKHACTECDRHDPGVAILDASLAHLFARCLQSAIVATEAAPSTACDAYVDISALSNLSDEDLISCFDNNSGPVHVREDLATFLTSYPPPRGTK